MRDTHILQYFVPLSFSILCRRRVHVSFTDRSINVSNGDHIPTHKKEHLWIPIERIHVHTKILISQFERFFKKWTIYNHK